MYVYTNTKKITSSIQHLYNFRNISNTAEAMGNLLLLLLTLLAACLSNVSGKSCIFFFPYYLISQMLIETRP